jgi:hypothetical protein
MRGGRGSGLLVIGVVIALLSACGEDDQQLVVEPPVSPTASATTPDSTPADSTTATATAIPTAIVTTSATQSTPTATPTVTPSPTPTAVDIDSFVGVYDVSFDTEFRRSAAIAEVFLDGTEVAIVFWSDGHGVLSLTGTPTVDGRVTLEGFGGVPNDYLFLAEGTARFDESNGRQRIHGSSSRFSGPSGPFVLDRPALRATFPFNGTYRFAFDPSPGGCECTTTATFTIVVEENGIGASTLAADELDAGGNRQGTFDSDECLVTTRGRLRCVLRYETTFVPTPGQPPAGPVFWTTVWGVLTRDGSTVTGEGRADAPIFPQVYFLGGNWTATRVAP